MKTSSNLNFTIFQHLKAGLHPSKLNDKGQEENSICAVLGLKKNTLSYHLSTLKRGGFIRHVGYGTWEILKEFKEVKKRSSKEVQNFSLGSRPITNLHALQINIPILEGTIKDSDWKIKETLKHWLPKYTELKELGGLTLKNNNNKSVTIFAKSRNLTDLQEVDNLVFKIRAYIFEFFKTKHDVILDVMNAEVKNLNLATEDKPSESMIRKGEKFELDLNKKAEKILPPDKIDAKAWIDGSPFKFSAETNDKQWKRSYLRMPFNVESLTNSLPVLDEYNTNLKLHTAVQVKQLKSADKNIEVSEKNLKVQEKTLQIQEKTLQLMEKLYGNGK